MGRLEETENGEDQSVDIGLWLLGAKPGGAEIPRKSLLQKEFGRSNLGLGVKPGPHHPIEKNVGQRHEGHPLVMRHERPHHNHFFVVRKTRGCVIQRIVETEPPIGPLFHQAAEIVRGFERIHHRGQSGGVRGDHQILRKPPLQAKPGNAKGGVLVRKVKVLRVEGGLGNAPGDMALFSVGDLTVNNGAAGMAYQAPRGGLHDEGRHQVFEHRSRPGQERRAPRQRRKGPRQTKPVRGRNVSLGNGDKTGEPGFGSQHVVVNGVRFFFRWFKSDKEEFFRRIKKQAEVHGLDGLIAGARQRRQTAKQVRGVLLRGKVPPVSINLAKKEIRPF